MVVSTICKFLHKKWVHLSKASGCCNQDALLREKYILDVSLYSCDMLVFVDETGADRRNRMRKYMVIVSKGSPLLYCSGEKEYIYQQFHQSQRYIVHFLPPYSLNLLKSNRGSIFESGIFGTEIALLVQ